MNQASIMKNKPSNFAKLFDTDIGQVLLVKQNGEKGPEVVVYFDPAVEDMDVCSFTITFEDSDAGRQSAEAAFLHIDNKGATEAARISIAEIHKAVAGVHA